MEKTYIGCCIDNPFLSLDALDYVITNSKRVTQKRFFSAIDQPKTVEMKRFPHDYEYFASGDIYFYTHSCIEYFYA